MRASCELFFIYIRFVLRHLHWKCTENTILLPAHMFSFCLCLCGVQKKKRPKVRHPGILSSVLLHCDKKKCNTKILRRVDPPPPLAGWREGCGGGRARNIANRKLIIKWKEKLFVGILLVMPHRRSL